MSTSTLICNGITIVSDTSKNEVVDRILDIIAGNSGMEFVLSCETKTCSYKENKHIYKISGK